MAKIVQIAELSVYGEEDEILLENLSFTVDEGEVAQLTGLTERQYDTLFQVLTGELTPNSGQVVLGDRNVVRLGRKKKKNMLRDEVSFLPRNFILPKEKTVLQSLRFKLKVTGEPPDTEERVNEVLGVTKLRGEGDTSPFDGDEVKRVKTALAISVAAKPDLLVCHDPFLSLDSKESETILDILREINEQMGASVLLLADEVKADREKVQIIESNLDQRVVG